MTDTEPALEHLNRLRKHVDGDLAEFVDVLSRMVLLKQDISDPMFGAQVTLHEKPPGTWAEVSYDYYRQSVDDGDALPDDPETAWDIRTDADNPAYGRDDEPWYLRWVRYDGDNHKHTPEGEVSHTFKRFFGYGEKQKVERESVPDPLSPDTPLEEDIENAREMEAEMGPDDQWHGEWKIYEVDYREYRFTPFVPVEEFNARKGIVFEPFIAGQPSDTTFWDPHREEYTTPDEYPMGTVNVIVPDDVGEEFGDDYVSNIRTVTSVTPADGEPGATTYTPGWAEN